MFDLKSIEYRGGLLRFAIPATWIEEYEPEGGGTFYLDDVDSGTLRVNVLTFEGKSRPDKEALLGAVAGHGMPEWLPTGNALVSYRATATEGGDALVLFYWELANSVAPRHLRLAVFSYTVLASQAESPAVREVLALLAEELRKTTFADTLGTAPA